jgi:hypothetical protein
MNLWPFPSLKKEKKKEKKKKKKKEKKEKEKEKIEYFPRNIFTYIRGQISSLRSPNLLPKILQSCCTPPLKHMSGIFSNFIVRIISNLNNKCKLKVL